jgi:hypothetical protein
MPWPCLMVALAHGTSRAALVVLGNSTVPYDPPIRVAEKFAMLDVMSGAGSSQATRLAPSMDANYAYGRVPETCVAVTPRHTISSHAPGQQRSHLSSMAGTPIALCQLLAKADAKAASADLDPWRRLD